MPKLNRTEIAAIAARLREHARRATIEKNYQVPATVHAKTRNDLAKRLRYLAVTIENTDVVSPNIISLLNRLDTRNPADAARHIVTTSKS